MAMTSKTSFFNSLREDVRHRIWVPSLACVVFLLGLIFSTLTIQDLSFQASTGIDSYLTARLVNQITCMYDHKNFLLTIVAVTGAIICGMQGFSYLTSKCQLDFYHSLPLKREKFFLIRWCNGVLFYAVPALVFSVLSCIMLAAFGFFSAPVLFSVVTGFLHNLLIFLLVYHSAILACMVTGNILVSLGLLGIMFIYTFTITKLVPTFMSVYYDTYTNFSSGLAEYLNYLAPGWLIINLFNAPTVGLYVFTIIFAAALLAVSVLLYRMRSSEAAGKAIAFPRFRSVLRVLVVIPVALYIGLAFGQLAPGFSAFWSIFGLLVFLVLTHAILEVIFDFDIHSAFHHKKEMLACAVFCVAFTSVFLTDVLKLDEQIPSQHSVKAVYMDLPIDNDMSYSALKSANYVALTSYREEHAFLAGDDLDKAYDLLAYRSAVAQPLSEEVTDDKGEERYHNVLNLNVRFVKNNGQSEYRHFQFVLEDAEAALGAVYDTATYKQGHYQILDPACKDAFSGMTVTDAADNMMVRESTHTNLFTAKETSEFIDVLQKDVSAFTYEQLTSEIPVARVDFSNENTGANMQYYIYPYYTESIAWMKGKGIDFDSWQQNEAVSLYISKNQYEPVFKEDTAASVDAASIDNEAADSYPVVITDPEVIASIYPYLHNEYFATRTQFNEAHADIHKGVTATITWKNGDDQTESYFVIDSACDLSNYVAASEE